MNDRNRKVTKNIQKRGSREVRIENERVEIEEWQGREEER